MQPGFARVSIHILQVFENASYSVEFGYPYYRILANLKKFLFKKYDVLDKKFDSYKQKYYRKTCKLIIVRTKTAQVLGPFPTKRRVICKS